MLKNIIKLDSHLFTAIQPKIITSLYIANSLPYHSRVSGYDVKYNLYGGIIKVPFLLDTGYSGMIVINKEIAEQLKLQRMEHEHVRTVEGKIEGIKYKQNIIVSIFPFEQTHQLQTELKHSFKMQPLTLENQNLNILGLLGMEMLKIGINIEDKYSFIEKNPVIDFHYFDPKEHPEKN